jgi:hypothetical protein
MLARLRVARDSRLRIATAATNPRTSTNVRSDHASASVAPNHSLSATVSEASTAGGVLA